MVGLLGRRQTPLGLAVLMGLIYLAQFWTPWLLWVAITLAVGGLRWTHPSVMCPERSVPTSRRVLGLVCVLVFVLTFMPVPGGFTDRNPSLYSRSRPGRSPPTPGVRT